MYKTKLQELCQQRRWGLPKFTSMKDGADHNPRFKASVTVNRLSFDSPYLCKSSKDAQSDAAKLAFLHFTNSPSLPMTGTSADQVLPESDNVDSNTNDSCVEDEIHDYEECPGFYKNLLQELVQREGFHILLYKTAKSGASHMPIFISSVEVEGELFQGKAGKSKKEAEKKAAKVALTALKERAQSRNSGATPHNPATDDIVKHTGASEGEKVEEESSTEIAPSNSLFSIATPRGDETTGKQNILFQSLSIPKSSKDSPDVSTLSISSSHMGKATRTKSYLLCNKVRVYPYFPDVAFPNGITMLPIGDDRWVAVSLEFPNETGS